MAIFDYLHSDEGRKTIYWGVEGVHFNWAGNERQIIKEAYDRDIGSNHLSEMRNLGESPYFRHAEFYPQILLDEIEATGKYGVADRILFMPPVDDIDTYKNINAQVNEVRNQWFPSFITGEKSVEDDWDEFEEQIKRAGLEDYVAGLKKYAKIIGGE